MQPRSSRCWLVAVAAAVLVGLPLAGAASLSEAAAPPGRGERAEGSPPKPLVLHFNFIPAESFLDTLKQLGRNPLVGEALEQIPMALNQPANAVVVLAPPEVAEFLIIIAKGLDQPNEFRAIMMQQEQREMEFRLRAEAARRQAASPPGPGRVPAPPLMVPGGPQPGRQMAPGPREEPRPGAAMPPRRQGEGGPPPGAPALRPGQGRPLSELLEGRRTRMLQPNVPRPEVRPGQPREEPRPGQATPPRRPEAPPEGRGPARESAAPAPAPMLRQFWALVSPEVRQKFDISEEQADRIRAILTEAARGMADVMEHMQGAMRDVPPEKRPVAVREWLQKNAPDRLRQIEEMREQILRILSPAQRERAQQWLRERAPESLREQPRPEAPASPRREPGQGLRGRGGPPGAPAVGESPARFWFVQQERKAAPVAGAAAATAIAPQGDILISVQAYGDDGKPVSVPVTVVGEGGGKAAGVSQGGVILNVQAEGNGAPVRVWSGAAGGGKLTAPNMEQVRAAMAFRWLDDPDMRADLGLSAEQESKIAALQGKHKATLKRIQDEATLQFGRENENKPMDDDARQAQRGEVGRAMAEAMHAAQPELDAIVKDTYAVLTAEQQTKLEQLIRERTRLMASTGALWVLTTRRAQQELGLSDETVAKIKRILNETADRLDEIRKEAFTGLKDVQPEQRGEAMRARWEALSKQSQELSGKARESVFALLADPQKPKAETMVAEAAQRGRGGYGGFGGGQFFGGGANGVLINPAGGPGSAPGGAWAPGQAKPGAAERPSPLPGATRPGAPAGGARAPEFGPRARLAVQESAARFSLAEEAGGPPPGAGGRPPGASGPPPGMSGPPPGMGGQGGGPPPWVGMMQNMFSPEDQERIREMVRQGQGLQYLEDPDVRNDLKITPQQEKKIQELRERATGLVSAISEDLRARFQDRTPPPDMTDEQRQVFMQEMAKAVADTVRGSLNEFEGMLGEVNTLLTDEQKAMLKQIGPMRAQSDQLTGGLSYLTTSQARQEFTFTYDQAERIKMIVRDVEADAKKLRDEIAGPGKEPTPEELRGEKFAPFREGQKEMVKKGLDRIMTILTGEQRDKVQKWSETRMGRTSRQGMRGRRGGPGGGQPGGGPEGPRPGGPPEGRPPAPPAGGAR